MANSLQTFPGAEVKFEKKSSILGEFKITVASKVMQERMQSAFQNLQKKAKLPGFREGKVPLDLLKKKYHGDVLNDVFNRLAQDAYRAAAIENKVPVAGDPQILESNWLLWQEGKPVEFTAQVDLIPDVQLKKYKGLPIEKKDAKIEEKDVDVVIRNLLDPRAELASLPEGTKVQNGHLVEIDFQGALDGENLQEAGAKNFQMEVGGEGALPEFHAGILGMRSGEEKKISVPYRQDYPNAQIAGKTVDYQVKILEVRQKNYPELTDELAKEFQAESAADLRQKVRTSLEEEMAAETKQHQQEAVLAAFLEANPFEVPPSLVERQLQYILNDVSRLLKRQQFSDALIQDYFRRHWQDFQSRALREVKIALLLPQVIGTEKIEADEPEMRQHVRELAKNSRQDPEKMEQFYFDSKERTDDLKRDVQRQKALDLLVREAKLK